MVSRWERRNDPDYWAAFEESRRRLLSTGWAEAWHTLGGKLRSGDEHVQVSAARVILTAVARERPHRHEITGAEGGLVAHELVLVEPVDAEEGEERKG